MERQRPDSVIGSPTLGRTGCGWSKHGVSGRRARVINATCVGSRRVVETTKAFDVCGGREPGIASIDSWRIPSPIEVIVLTAVDLAHDVVAERVIRTIDIHKTWLASRDAASLPDAACQSARVARLAPAQ